MQSIIGVHDLVKRYGDFAAVKGVSFSVEAGECFGLLGPNGAGKTSTMRMLTAVSPITGGRAVVAGLDVAQQPREVKKILGIVPQDENLDPDLSVLGNLLAHARYFRIPRSEARQRAQEALKFLALWERAESRVDALSGGMKRRLVIARALLSHPTVLVLDEPTTGLDPAGRHLVWSRVLELRRQGATILLSTHNMEEAMALCDRLVIIDGGRVLAQGKPRDLVLEYAGREVVEVRPAFGEMESVKGLLTSRGLRVEEAGTALLVLSRNGDALERDLAVEGLHVVHRTANLEDVFLRLTGRGLEEGET